MDPVIQQFANLGGMGLLSLVLYLLHREALKTFREETAVERQHNAVQLGLEREQNAAQLLADRQQNAAQQDKDRTMYMQHITDLYKRLEALSLVMQQAKCRMPPVSRSEYEGPS